MVESSEHLVLPAPVGEVATAQNSIGVLNQKIAANEQTKQQIDFGLISNNFDKYIVRPLNAFGLGGFVFDNEDETQVTLSADITDHYTEDNVVIQDHIAVKPKKVTLKSFVGELVYRGDESTETTTQQVTRKLTVLNQYLPILSSGAKQARDAFLDEKGEISVPDITFDNAVRGATDIYSLVKNLTPPTQRQEQAYMFFKALMEQKILVSVQTPFEFMNNMAIEGITATQTGNSKDISEFSITLKEIRFAELETVPFNSEDYQSRTDGQREELEKQGDINGSSESITYDWLYGDDDFDPNEFNDLRAGQ